MLQMSFTFANARLSDTSLSDASLMVRDQQGHYQVATPDQILEAARAAIDAKMPSGALFDEIENVKEYLRTKLTGLEHEVFAVLFLDVKLRLIAYREMFRGSIAVSPVYPREVLKEALRLNAASVIISHNHPSGDPTPSEADKIITRELKKALAFIDVRVADHIVVGGADTLSFAEHRIM